MLDHRKGLQILPQRGNHDFGACLIFSFDHTHLERKLWYYCDIIMLPEWETRAETLKHSETFSSHLIGPDNFLVAWPCSCRHFTILLECLAYIVVWKIWDNWCLEMFLWFSYFYLFNLFRCLFNLFYSHIGI